ncbi:MAG: ATP-dependent Clp protease proteolytic subunit [Alphaproteobacteria bacterium]|nr:ATP-dependent Clp protease proteolytic subunit [Alphaproteobacteria bacterium]
MSKANKQVGGASSSPREEQSSLPEENAPIINEASPATSAENDKKANEDQPPKSWIEIACEGNEKEIQTTLAREIKKILTKHNIDNYLTLLLFDPFLSIADSDLNRLYQAASANEEKTRDILLIIHSSGGSIEPAYLISKTLKTLSKNKFVVAVPRLAKSAATLICLGANEIHMGLTSQLGPIDPQINGFPALGLSNSLDTLANLASRFPNAGKVLSDYLISKLDLSVLGYFNRVTESAIQYGERLLAGKQLAKGKTAHDVADQLVNYYKDHGFVIDVDEATSLLGASVVKTKTPEYKAANDIFNLLDFFRVILREEQKKKFYYTGSIDGGLKILERRPPVNPSPQQERCD